MSSLYRVCRKKFYFIVLGSSFTLLILSFINLISYFSSEDNSYQDIEQHISRVDNMRAAQHNFQKHGEVNNLDTVDPSEASEIMKTVKILCWIMTMPKNFETKAITVKNTWGKRCDKLIFMSSVTNSSLPSIDLKLGESRKLLWGKTKRAFKYCYDHYINEFDWFLKADDDTYVVIENLKYVLNIYNPKQDGIYFGIKLKYIDRLYMSGGAGYVLSKKALEMFVEKGLPDERKCLKSNGGAEDVRMGKCLNNVGVIAGDSRDRRGRGRFFPFRLTGHVNTIPPSTWYWRYVYYPAKNGRQYCSDLPISFHYISINVMNELEYMFYHAHVFGLNFKDGILADLPPDKNSIPGRMLMNSTSLNMN